MARKIYNWRDIKRDGESITDTSQVISYLADTSRDNLSLSQQYFILTAGDDDRDINIPLRQDALFTYFFEAKGNNNTGVTIKINNGETEFSIAPDFWSEDVIDRIEASLPSGESRLIYVYQVYAQGVAY